MNSIKVEFYDKELRDIELELSRIEKVVDRKAVVVKSINDVARNLVAKHKRDLPKHFDRPKNFTINSLYAQFANSKWLFASIEYKARAGKKILKQHWLAPSVFGGTRRDKGLDIALKAFNVIPPDYQAIPTDDIQTDGHGNVPAGLVKQIISYLRVDLSGTQNRVTGRMNANQRRLELKRKARFFVVPIGSTNNMSPGIYEYRAMFGGRAVRKLFSFAKAPTYEPRFPFFETSKQFVETMLPKRIMERVEAYLKSGKD